MNKNILYFGIIFLIVNIVLYQPFLSCISSYDSKRVEDLGSVDRLRRIAFYEEKGNLSEQESSILKQLYENEIVMLDKKIQEKESFLRRARLTKNGITIKRKAIEELISKKEMIRKKLENL